MKPPPPPPKASPEAKKAGGRGRTRPPQPTQGDGTPDRRILRRERILRDASVASFISPKKAVAQWGRTTTPHCVTCDK